MSSKDDPKPQRTSHSGSTSSIGLELGEDLDFEADALLDSLLSDDGPRPNAAVYEAPVAAGAPSLHAPATRAYPDDEVTWVGKLDDAMLASLAAARATQPPVAASIAPPAVAASVALPEAPTSTATVRPGPTLSRAPRTDASPQSGVPTRTGLTAPRPAQPGSLEDEEVTRLHRLDALAELRTEAAAPSSADDAATPEGSLHPSIGPSADLGNLSELSFEDANDDAIEEFFADPAFAAGGANPRPTVSVAPDAPDVLVGEACEFEDLPSRSDLPGSDAPEGDDDVQDLDDEPDLVDLTASSFPPDGPLSHTAPPEQRSPSSLFPDERPAASHLEDSAAWKSRAEWLEGEALKSRDPQAKARTFLLASELWALTGDLERARELASEASKAGSAGRPLPLVARQLRSLSASERDFEAVANALDAELRSAATPEARVHAAYFSAEVQRICRSDEANARKRIELAVRADQDDVRAHLAKLIEAMSKSAAPPRLRLPESPGLREIVALNEEIGRLRGAPAPVGTTASPSLAFEQARVALANGERSAAAALVARLREIEGIGNSALWLAASLSAHDRSGREQAFAYLELLSHGPAGALARRALAARALEHGSADALGRALDSAAGTFTAAERVALGALTGEDGARLAPALTQLVANPEGRPLAAAVSSALGTEGATDALLGDPEARAAQALGFVLAKLPGAQASGPSRENPLWSIRAAGLRFADTDPDHPLSIALRLAFATDERRPSALAAELARLSSDDGATQRREIILATALAYEFCHLGDEAEASYADLLRSDPASSAALRARLESADREGAQKLLVGAAEAAPDATQAALYFMEAALRLGPEDAERYDGLLQRALEIAPSLTLLHGLGEQRARTRGDTEKLLGWLRSRREQTEDPLETALDLVREALLVAEANLPLSVSLLADALSARPDDVALQELHERISGSTDAERAAWREVAAASAEGERERRELYAQAALGHHRARAGEQAVRAATTALSLGAGELLGVLCEENAFGTPAAARVSEALLAQVRISEDAGELRELYERLSKLDRARGDASSALLWQNAILERSPDHLPALRQVEHAYLGANRLEELEPIAARLAAALDGAEGDAHARLAARIRIQTGAWSSVKELLGETLSRPRAELWALRMLQAQARADDEPSTTLGVALELESRGTRPADRATLLLRAAEALVRTNQLERAQEVLERALLQVPDHHVALITLAEVLEARADFRSAAATLAVLAEVSQVAAHRVSAWHQAAVLWLDKAGDGERGRAALEQAVALDIGNEDAVVRLQAIYVSLGDREKLAGLLERRLERTTDPEERVALEVTRGRALFDVGERAAAKVALSAALDANPEHVEALQAFADLCSEEGDWSAAEQALIRLVRHVPEPTRQANLYRRLGDLYDSSLPNAERAELSYREVLRRAPDDADTVSRLVTLLARRGASDQAVTLASEFALRASTPDEKRDRTLSLAFVVEEYEGDRKKAEGILEKARKEAPLEPLLLRAQVSLAQRGGNHRGAQILLDRAAVDSRRALATGRFDPALFEMLATVAELRGAQDAAALATATLRALAGEEVTVDATGQAAGDPRLDEQLAPELLTPALRNLLKKAGHLLDAAYPLDLRALRAAPLPEASSAFVAFVRNVAQSFGIQGLEVLLSPTLGAVCVPVSARPPVLVFGQALLEHQDDAARFFLLMRCLKVLQAQAAALSRTAPIELPAVMSALLSLFATEWQPQGVDSRKLAEAQQRLRAVASGPLDDDLPLLALEVVTSLGNRSSQLATALHQWGDRAGLLAVGSPSAALRGIALSAGQLAGPPAGAERVKWVVRNPEARDLAVFSVSDAYAEARVRLGVGR